MDKDKFEQIVETFIDSHGLASLCGSVAYICYEKSDHIKSTWQDTYLAKAWNKAGDLFDRLANKLPSGVG